MKIFALLLVLGQACSASFFDWLGWSEAPKEQASVLANGVPLMSVPFEELAPEEKFLVEASKITGLKLSQLDTCQHKLVMKLKASCGSLSEEELAKLSVNLLNCQSAVEGRTEYPCNENMSLKECTKNMDPETWNAYHVVSNRARAVCYAARQQQFRALSEMTVNKLMSTAHSHISALTSLEGTQERMAQAALKAVEEVNRTQSNMIKGQTELKASQRALNRSVAETLDGLQRERDLVRALQADFSALVGSIQSRLEESEKLMEKESTERKSEQDKLMLDLLRLSSLASEIWIQIDESTKSVVQQHEIVNKQFKTTLENLMEINSSISYISGLIGDIRRHADSKLGYIIDFIGDNGERLESVLVTLEQLVALVCAMMVCCFLDVARVPRWILLCAAPANLYLALNKDHSEMSVPTITLYTGFAAFALVHFLASWGYDRYMKRKGEPTESNPGPQNPIDVEPKKTFPDMNNEEVPSPNGYTNGFEMPFVKVNEWLKVRSKPEREDSPVVSPNSNGFHRNFFSSIYNTPITQKSKQGGGEEDEDDDLGSVASSLRRRQNFGGASSPRSVAESSASGGRTTCSGTTLAGKKCKNLVVKGVYCGKHLIQAH